MEDQNDARVIGISTSVLDVDAIYASFSDDIALSTSVQSASVLIVPTDLEPQYEGPAFPSSTRDFFRTLQSGFDEDTTVEVAVRDEDYREFEYRSECIILPVLWISSHILLPTVINLISAYIADKFRNRFRSNASDEVKSEIHFTAPSGAQVNYKYEGPPSTYETVSTQHLRELGIWLGGGPPTDDDKQ